MFSPEQVRKYAEVTFPNHRFTDRPDQRMQCPIHQGRDKNFALNMDQRSVDVSQPVRIGRTCAA